MKYENFEDLPVWNEAADLAADMLIWTTDRRFRGKGDLANQLQRASLSISNNIAEGFERGTTSELLKFLYYARGSAAEVRSMLAVMQRMEAFCELDVEIVARKSACTSIAKQVRGWANCLQNSEIQGQRHLNDKTRRKYEAEHKKTPFQLKMEEFRVEFEARIKREAAEHARTHHESNPPSDFPPPAP